MAGMIARDRPGIAPRPRLTPLGSPVNTPLENQYQVYTDAVNSDVGTSSALMGQYQDLFNTFKGSTAGQTFTPNIPTAQTYRYTPNENYLSALSRLNALADTGGYSPTDIQALRERAISPIRSIYEGANRDIDRSRTLTGGYSPSYNVLKAKMARESSEQIARAMNDVNANLAERVAEGKRGAISQLASTTAGENELMNRVGLSNTDIQNRFAMNASDLRNKADMMKLQLPTQNTETLAGILDRMKSLYGTTPGKSALYGSQAMQGAGLQNNIKQQNEAGRLRLIGQRISGGR